MAQCAFCKAETELYDGGTPVCVKCADARDAGNPSLEGERSAPLNELQIREILRREVLETTSIVTVVSEEFNAMIGGIPSGVPQPDGTHRIQNASRRMSEARKEMIKAHSRLNDYLGRGIIPEDLKRTQSNDS